MELVKENNTRWAVFISVVLAIVYLFILLDSRVTLLMGTLFIIGMIIFFTLIFYSRKKNCSIYFSEKGIKFAIGSKKNEFKWNELKVDLKRDYIKYLKCIDYKFSSVENNKNYLFFSICWENEKSIIELTQKYVPRDHAFYAVVKDYTEKRGIKF